MLPLKDRGRYRISEREGEEGGGGVRVTVKVPKCSHSYTHTCVPGGLVTLRIYPPRTKGFTSIEDRLGKENGIAILILNVWLHDNIAASFPCMYAMHFTYKHICDTN